MALIYPGESAAGSIRMYFTGCSHTSQLQSSQAWVPPPPQGQYVPPPPPAATAGGPGGKIALIAIIVAMVIVVAGIGAYIMLNPSGGNTPDGAVTEFSELFSDGDFESAYNATILSLGDDYDEFVESQKTAFGNNLPDLSLDDISFTSSGDMTESEKEDAQDLIDDIESEYDVTVDDYCLMEYTLAVDYGDFEETITDEMLCVKIGGVWYMTEAFDLYPSVVGAWNLQSMTMVMDDETTSLDESGIIFLFNETGTGLIYYIDSHMMDEENRIDFTWERTARNMINMDVDGMPWNCTYSIQGYKLTLEMEIEEYGMTAAVEMELVRYDGDIDFGDDDAVFATDFTLPQVGGGQMTLSSLRGKVVVLDFMATWCGPCETELDHLKVLYGTYDSSVLAVISIDIDYRENETLLSGYIAEHDIPWPVLMDTSGISRWSAYEAFSIPLILIIDQDGYIQYRHVGVTDSSTLMAEIETLL